MARLVVLSEGFTGKTYELKVDRTTIGRMEDNSFQIAEPSISSHHCEIIRQGDSITVKDLSSTNGTYISGEKITEKVLKPGQVLRLGQVQIRLETGDKGPGSIDPTDKTMVINRGVKKNQLEDGTHAIKFEKDSPFSKKSNKSTVIFISACVVAVLVIIAALVLTVVKMSGSN
ncbi:MAG TPA: FHA domain-containing protein [Verrucomicrobiales bacterium]|nr:FHA domain-containing protein [Verrucomicrobiales bacterium]HIL71451.1 FHA domain-containing protein [Verrucomicrobiota bacterium]